MIKHPIGIFISGRGSNLKSIVNACKEQEYPAEIKVVFSNNKNAPGLSFAKENNLEAITLDYHNFKNTEEYEEKIISLLKPYDLELICLAGYMKILSKKLIDHYPNKIINIHPSLLPKYKGLNTHRRVLENNETKTGCTVHYVNQEMDGGEIILQREKYVYAIIGPQSYHEFNKTILKIENKEKKINSSEFDVCLLYTSDAADD